MTVDVHSLSLKYKDGGLQKGIVDLDRYAKTGDKASKSTTEFTAKVGVMNTAVKAVGTVTLPAAKVSVTKFTSELKPASTATAGVADQVHRLSEELASGSSKLVTFGAQAGSSTSVFTDKIGLLNTTIKQTGTVALPKASNSFSRFAASLKPAKNAAQLVAFQVQDLAVQLSMGTSAMIAFGQQAPQLASAFGPGGAVLGAIAGVGFAIAGPLIAAFSSGEDAASDFQSAIDGVRDSLKSTRLEVNQGAVNLLKTQIRESTEAIDELNKSTERTNAARLRLNVKSRIEAENNAKILELEKDRVKNAEVLAELYRQQSEIQQEGGIGGGGKNKEILDQEGELLRHRFELNKQDVADKRRTEAEKTRLTAAGVRQREAVERASIAVATTTMGQLVEIARAGGEESFQAYKRLAQSQAALSAALGVMAVIADPMIPTIAKPFAIGATVGLAAVQIASIDSQQYSARENGGQVQAGSKILVGERGPEVLELGAQGGFVTPNSRLGGGGDSTVVFQIGNGVQSNVRAEVMAMAPDIMRMFNQSMKGRR